MYRRPRFLEELHAIREEMSREADYDVVLFAEMTRTGVRPAHGPERNIRGFRSLVPHADADATTTTPTTPTKVKTNKSRKRATG